MPKASIRPLPETNYGVRGYFVSRVNGLRCNKCFSLQEPCPGVAAHRVTENPLIVFNPDFSSATPKLLTSRL
jgi:hypothetical protein